MDVLRIISETFIVFSVMMTSLSSDKDIKKLFIIYIFAFAFFSIWGIIEGGRIRTFLPLEDEDSFGPFMCIGISFAYYIRHIYENKIFNKFCLLTSILCLIGAVVSFARGTFVSLVILAIFAFFRSDNKVRLVAHSILLIFICLIIINVFSPEFYNNYKKEVSTIWEQGTEEQTAKDRIYLWKKAWAMFIDYPLIGVGPGCYGFRLERYYDSEDYEKWDVRYIQTFGRATHNIYFQIIAEMGLLGLLSLLILLYYFWKRNLFARASAIRLNKSDNFHENHNIISNISGKDYYYYSYALESGMIAFLVNGFFFNILFYSWFWDMQILNILIFQKMRELKS